MYEFFPILGPRYQEFLFRWESMSKTGQKLDGEGCILFMLQLPRFRVGQHNMKGSTKQTWSNTRTPLPQLLECSPFLRTGS